MADKTLDLIRETSYSSFFVRNCETRYKFMWLDDHVGPLMRSILESITEMLKNRENINDEKIAFTLLDLKGAFIFGAILTYTKAAEGEDGKGNWNLEFTFDKNDIDGVKIVGDNLNSEFITSVENNFRRYTNRRFKAYEFLHKGAEIGFNTLKDFITTNAKEGEIFSVEIPDYIEASSTIENGEYIIAVTPGSILKQSIKDDIIV